MGNGRQMSHMECVRIDGVEVTCLWKGEGTPVYKCFLDATPCSLGRKSALPREKEVTIYSLAFSVIMNAATSSNKNRLSKNSWKTEKGRNLYSKEIEENVIYE